MLHNDRIRPKKHAKAYAFYVDSLLIKIFIKERKRGKKHYFICVTLIWVKILL